MRLSVLDIGWPGDVAAQVPALARWGFARYWTSEHHTGVQSASPTVLAAAAASHRPPGSTMRIGVAGVLLRYRSARAVAADAMLLAALAGGVDVGLVAAPAGGDDLEAALLDGRPAPTSASYDAKVGEVVTLLREPPDDLGPAGGEPPLVWICGTSPSSAERAARHGTAFAFHHQLAGPDVDGRAVLDRYRQAFVPATNRAEPVAAIAVAGLCADTARRADRLVRTTVGNAPVGFAGTAPTCAEQVATVADDLGCDDVVLCALGGNGRDRLRSHELLAGALQPTPPA